MNKINWQKYFDAIWCIDYKPHKLRKQLIIKQLDRVGILEHKNFKFHETFPSPYDQYLYDKLLADRKFMQPFMTSVGLLNATFGHYACIKKSLLDNYQKILILENDTRFLKNIQEIKRILENIPNDADIILFDYFIHCSLNEFETYKTNCINTYFYHYNNLAATDCYMLSNKALHLFQQCYQNILFPPDVYTSKFGFADSLNKYFTLNNMACQVTFSDCLNVAADDLNTIHNTYKNYNLNYDNYNMNDGKQYHYGDYIIE